MRALSNLFVLMFLLVCPFVFADSDSRPASAAEKAYAGKFFAVARAALQSWKTDWVQIDKSEFAIYDRVATGNEEQPWYLDCFMRWHDQKAKEAENLRITGALPGMSNENLIQEADKLSDNLAQISEEINKAAESGDYQKVIELQKKAEELTAPSKKVFADHEKNFKEQLEKLVARDSYLEARIYANKFMVDFESLPGESKLANGKIVYRSGDGQMMREEWVEGTSIVVLGKGWKLNREGDYASLEASEPENFIHTQTYTLVVEVEADKTRAENFLNSLPWEKLQALLK